MELRNVFAVKVKRRRSVGQQWGGTLLGLTLFCCVRKGAKLKERPVHLNNLSADHCELWFRHLKELLSGKNLTRRWRPWGWWGVGRYLLVMHEIHVA